MNIVFVFDGLQVGGIERVGIDYIDLLTKEGHKLSVVNVSPKLNVLCNQLPDNVSVFDVKLPRAMVPYRYAKLIEKGVWGAIAYAIATIVLSAINFCYKTVTRFKLKRLANTDVVIAFSGHYNDLMFVASNYVSGKKIAWLHGAEFEYKVISDGYFALYRKIKNLVCLSELCDITCQKFNENSGIKKQLIYNPVMIREKKIDEKKVEELKGKYGKYVLMAGRLDPDKDQKTAILAIKYLNEKREKKIHILFAGDGVKRKELEAFSKEHQANEYVHFLGNCLDIQNYYLAAHVYVHSSPMEGLPTVLLEALAYGVPIAATDSIPGVREILGNQYYGLISKVGDWEELGDNIQKLYEDELLRKKMIIAGQRRVKDFESEASLEKLLKFIDLI